MGLYKGYIGIVGNKIGTTMLGDILRLYRGYMGIMEKKMRITSVGCGYMPKANDLNLLAFSRE